MLKYYINQGEDFQIEKYVLHCVFLDPEYKSYQRYRKILFSKSHKI